MSEEGQTQRTHEQVDEILREHERYVATEGREGSKADLSDSIVEDFDFSGRSMHMVYACGSVFSRCVFSGADLSGSDFFGSEMVAADFRGATLIKAKFNDADASGAVFDDARLANAEFLGTTLEGASFRNADLVGACFNDCDLRGAVMDGANIVGGGVADNDDAGSSWVGAVMPSGLSAEEVTESKRRVLAIRHQEALSRAAEEHHALILVVEPDPAVLPYLGQAGYRPRPPWVRGVTRREGPQAGLLIRDGHPLPEGYTASAAEGDIIMDPAGNALYEGLRLLGVYDAEGRFAYSETLRRELNRRLGAELVVEEPLESLAYDLSRSPQEAASLLPPRVPALAFTPTGDVERLVSVAALRALYLRFGVSWAQLYGVEEA